MLNINITVSRMMLGYEEIALCNTGCIVAMMMRMSIVGAMVVVAIFYSGAYLPIVMMVRYCWQQ